MRFCSTRSVVLALFLAACGGSPAPATPARATTAAAVADASPRLLPEERDIFMRISLDVIARTPLAGRVLPALSRVLHDVPLDAHAVTTFAGTERAGVRRALFVFDPRGPTAREVMEHAEGEHDLALD